MTRRIKLTVEYDGTAFHGWQRQKEARSVQQNIEEAIFQITGEDVRLHVAGRTDAGVHGKGQVCHFDTISKTKLISFKQGVNRFTDEDITILKAEEVTEDFHARFSATWRSYEFRLLCRREPSALLRNHAVHVRYPLDLEKMQKAAQAMLGEQDFSAFRTAICQSSTPMCNVQKVALKQVGDELIFNIQADHFLHNMIRITMGTLVDIGRGHLPEDTIKTMITSGERASGGVTLAPHGLYFMEVGFKPHEILESTD